MRIKKGHTVSRVAFADCAGRGLLEQQMTGQVRNGRILDQYGEVTAVDQDTISGLGGRGLQDVGRLTNKAQHVAFGGVEVLDGVVAIPIDAA